MDPNESPGDLEFERYLRRRDPLSRAYDELRTEVPPSSVDRAVLERAAAALAQPALRRYRWHTVAALAATVLLSFGLVLRLGLDADKPYLAGATRQAPEQAQGVVSTQVAPPLPASAPSPAALEDKRELSGFTRPATDSFNAPRPEPSLEEVSRQRAELLKQRTLSDDERAARAAKLENRDQLYAVPPPAPTAAEPAPVASSVTESAPATAAPQPAQERSKESDSTVQASPMRAEGRRDAGYAAARASAPAEAEVTAAKRLAAPVTSGAVAPLPPPEKWLLQIEELRKAGHNEEADRELERFKAAYPDYLETRATGPQK